MKKTMFGRALRCGLTLALALLMCPAAVIADEIPPPEAGAADTGSVGVAGDACEEGDGAPGELGDAGEAGDANDGDEGSQGEPSAQDPVEDAPVVPHEHAFDWSEAVPAAGLEGYLTASCIAANGCPAAAYRPADSSAVTSESVIGYQSPRAIITTPSAELAQLLTSEEQALLDSGATATLRLDVKPPADAFTLLDLLAETVAFTKASCREDAFGSAATNFCLFSMELFVQVDGLGERQLSELPDGFELAIDIEVPGDVFEEMSEDLERRVLLAHHHDGEVDILGELPKVHDGHLRFSVSGFSPFAFMWKDLTPVVPPAPSAPSGEPAPEPVPAGPEPPMTSDDAPSASEPETEPEPESLREPETPAAPVEPEPALPTPDEPVLDTPDASIEASASEPFLAWSPKQTRHRITLRWTPVEGADGYLISASRCSTHKVTRTVKPVATVGAGVTRWVDRGLSPGTWRKYVVRAFHMVDGQRVFIAKAKMVHACTRGGKSLVASGVRVAGPGGLRLSGCGASTELMLSAGDTLQLKARELGKRLLTHHCGIRFGTSDKSVVRINKSGKLRAVGAGTCCVWVQAQSGVWVMLRVTVVE